MHAIPIWQKNLEENEKEDYKKKDLKLLPNDEQREDNNYNIIITCIDMRCMHI